jgi:alkanesulfonate monooxygenase SsuD/methylene tetrahydromethanopterin reductase-like flavin-dependent oxidoreductase (luciferase family)
MPPPVDKVEMTDGERAMLDEVLACSVAGSEARVRAKMGSFLAQTQADEIIIACQAYDHAARRRSLEIAAKAGGLVSA